MSTLGIVIVATLLLFSLRVAAISLNASSGSRALLGLLALPVAALAGIVIAASVGVRPPVELLHLAPLAAGALVAALTKQLGYGVLAGLVVAAASYQA